MARTAGEGERRFDRSRQIKGSESLKEIKGDQGVRVVEERCWLKRSDGDPAGCRDRTMRYALIGRVCQHRPVAPSISTVASSRE